MRFKVRPPSSYNFRSPKGYKIIGKSERVKGDWGSQAKITKQCRLLNINGSGETQ